MWGGGRGGGGARRLLHQSHLLAAGLKCLLIHKLVVLMSPGACYRGKGKTFFESIKLKPLFENVSVETESVVTEVLDDTNWVLLSLWCRIDFFIFLYV